MKARTLVYLLAITIAVFAGVSYGLAADHVFHVLNAVAISVSLITVIAYIPALYDAWRLRANHILPGHLLAIGIVTSWTGLAIRLSRWFFTETEPTIGFEQWEYNIGLWFTILAAGFLISAVALTDPQWSRVRVVLHVVAFLVMMLSLWTFDYYWVGLPHFGPLWLPLRR